MVSEHLDDLLHEAADITRRHNHRYFRPGFDLLPVSGKIIGGEETYNALHAVVEGVLTAGPWTKRFEQGLARYVGVRHARMVNSGSSANLLALTALRYEDCREVGEVREALPDDAVVLTSMLAFPTTVNPILQNGMTPLLCDIELGTYVPSLETILAATEAMSRRPISAVMMAHTLGNPWPVAEVRRHHPEWWVIEDNCDALGSTILVDADEDMTTIEAGDWSGQLEVKTGSIGDLATQSFYPAHHITTGEGGAVLTNSGRMARVVESLRDWGRDCWCEPGKENTCGKRFGWDFPPLPAGTDHKYVYSRIGYNLKSTDIQAAIGVAQLDRLGQFEAVRARNFDLLRVGLEDDQDVFILPTPAPGTEPSWFGFPITLKADMPFSREDLVWWLKTVKMIDSRPIFAGAIIDQPGYHPAPEAARACNFILTNGGHPNARLVSRNGFWVGIWPGLNGLCILHIRDALHEAAEMMRKEASFR